MSWLTGSNLWEETGPASGSDHYKKNGSEVSKIKKIIGSGFAIRNLCCKAPKHYRCIYLKKNVKWHNFVLLHCIEMHKLWLYIYKVLGNPNYISTLIKANYFLKMIFDVFYTIDLMKHKTPPDWITYEKMCFF